MVIIGAEAPIVAGLEDELRSMNIFTLTPCKLSSIIESSKIFTRELLESNLTLKNVNLMFGDLKQELGNNISKESIVDSILKFRIFTSSNVVIKKMVFVAVKEYLLKMTILR